MPAKEFGAIESLRSKGRTAFLAPGQGIDSWADGLVLLDQSNETHRVYERVHDVTGVDIVDICERNEPVNDSSVVQAAALGIGVARALYLKELGVNPDYLIGLSSGEFTVAVIGGAMSVEDGALIAYERGIYQNEEAGGKGGAVVAIHGRRALKIQEIIRGLEGVNVLGFNSPIKTGFAYLHEDYEELVNRLRGNPEVRRVLDIPNLNFPPHGPAVEKVQKRLADLFKSMRLKRAVVNDTATPIIATKTARAMKRARTIQHNLIWQTTNPTNLKNGINFAVNRGVEDFYDLGPGETMSKLLGDFSLRENIRVHPVLT